MLACVALLANTIAVARPAFHAWAHANEEHHAQDPAAGHQLEHSHDEIHPATLHDDCILLTRDALDDAVAERVETVAFIVAIEEVGHRWTVAPVASRAPPGLDRARSPPTV